MTFPVKRNIHDGLSVDFHGKVPPNAVDLEVALLGGIMLESDCLNDVIEILRPESFYKIEHQNIYKAILELHAESSGIDILTVTARLKKNEVLDLCGGPYYVSNLTDRMASGANAEFHARIVQQKFIQREVIRISGTYYNESFEDKAEPLGIIERAINELNTLQLGEVPDTISSSLELYSSTYKDDVMRFDNPESITGITTGFRELDKFTSGWQSQDLIVIAARPAMGKTSFGLSTILHATEISVPVLVFSLEMGKKQIYQRIKSNYFSIPLEHLTRKAPTKDEIEIISGDNRLQSMPIYVDDTAAISIQKMKTKASRMKRDKNIGLIVVDYLQLMTAEDNGKRMNREQEISTISRGLKAMAKELDIPVIALSQLSRSVETRGGSKVPMLSDLRESGAIEQDADMVAFLYRPEYYGFDEDEFGTPTEGLAKFIIAKHRNGPTGDVTMRFEKSLAKYADYDELSHSFTANSSTMQSARKPYKDDEDDEDLPF